MMIYIIIVHDFICAEEVMKCMNIKVSYFKNIFILVKLFFEF